MVALQYLVKANTLQTFAPDSDCKYIRNAVHDTNETDGLKNNVSYVKNTDHMHFGSYSYFCSCSIIQSKKWKADWLLLLDHLKEILGIGICFVLRFLMVATG